LCIRDWAAAAAGSAGTPATVHRTFVLGHSFLGRPLTGVEVGDPHGRRRLVVVCCLHGDEQAGLEVVQELEEISLPPGIDLWLVENANPDGVAAWTRVNGRGVDLNRNFAWHWHRHGKRGDEHFAGRKPFSEPESRALAAFVLRVRPGAVIWYHQALDLVDESGGSLALEQRYARLAGMALTRLPRYPGSATSWVNAHLPGATSFVVELPPGDLGTAAALRQAASVVQLAQSLEPGA
jgi:protein MpaA